MTARLLFLTTHSSLAVMQLHAVCGTQGPGFRSSVPRVLDSGLSSSGFRMLELRVQGAGLANRVQGLGCNFHQSRYKLERMSRTQTAHHGNLTTDF